jgi:thymidine phosphorylase
VQHRVVADRAGFVSRVNTRALGVAVIELGGGRRKPEDPVDHAVGLTGLLPVGAEVGPGQVLAIVHARSSIHAATVDRAVKAAYGISNKRPRRVSPVRWNISAPNT